VLDLIYPLGALLMIFLPAGLGILIAHRLGGRWTRFGAGALTFVGSQAVHLPLNAGLTLLVARGLLPAPPPAWRLAVNAAVLGLTAGVCEELARYVAYRWPLRAARRWEDGLMFGAGHGGMESVILGVLAGLTFLNMLALREADPSTLAPSGEQLAVIQAQLGVYWGVAWYAPLVGVLERVSALTLHLAFATLVLQTFLRGSLAWLGAAVAWHAAVDAVAVVGPVHWGLAATEAVIAGSAVVGAVVVLGLRPRPRPVAARA
jgi:uncharacterized membrane protein YhfC